jgi:hypothetical protein
MCKNVFARDLATRLGVKLAKVFFRQYKIAAAVKRGIGRIERQML